MKLLKVLSSEFDKLKRLTVKVWNGKSYTLTAEEIASYGTDSRPIKDMVAFYIKSEVDGAEVIAGYLIKDRLADVGEHRTFSTDENGNVKAYVWLKKNGKMLLSGDQYNLTRFQQLETGFNQLKADHNALVALYNAHFHPYLNVATPASTSPPTTPGTTSTASIANAKAEDLLTK